MYKYLTIILFIWLVTACENTAQVPNQVNNTKVSIVDYPTPGAEQVNQYLPLLSGKQVGVVVNKASRIGETHLVDVLIGHKVDISKIFAPEHGFRGEADAGAKINDEQDEKTGLPIISLYGKNKKPSSESISDLDVIVFDLQDVGVRFYTYISTLHYVMESAAENGKTVIVLDRPNPNGFYVAGPILEEEYKSFVGMHPVPIVYGMTIGEYAQMINGEGWLEGGKKAQLTVIPCVDYTHNMTFELPVRPSPNLPNLRSILLYPSLCLFEGSTVSVGRGTDAPFQQIGHPKLSDFDHSFVPKSGYGAKYPKHENKFCFGHDFTQMSLDDIIEQEFTLDYIIEYYQACQAKETAFFNDNNFFEKLAGTELVRTRLVKQLSTNESSQFWKKDCIQFNSVREKYLLYN